MAKVTGPLFSVSASGKVADAMVHFPWKGRNVVRQWLKPANPQSGEQGDVRLILGGTGRACGHVNPDSGYHQQLIDLNLLPNSQTKQSYLVQQIIDRFMSTPTLFEAEYTAYAAHTAKAAFDSQALTEGMYDFNVTYKATTHAYVAGLQLYMMARVAIALGFTGSPYTTALASWTATEITAMRADFV